MCSPDRGAQCFLLYFGNVQPLLCAECCTARWAHSVDISSLLWDSFSGAHPRPCSQAFYSSTPMCNLFFSCLIKVVILKPSCLTFFLLVPHIFSVCVLVVASPPPAGHPPIWSSKPDLPPECHHGPRMFLYPSECESLHPKVIVPPLLVLNGLTVSRKGQTLGSALETSRVVLHLQFGVGSP